jgi:diadenosine tetraphosphate (Ap4A) HIT family hydrolase
MGSDPKDCFYCARDERLTRILIEICRLEASTLYLFREQTYRGRCVVALDAHATELFQLDRDTLQRFTRDVARAAAALQRAFGPDKINYAIYGDLAPHLHYHVVPKYRGGAGWGEPFALHPPAQQYLTEDDYGQIIAAITAHLPA